MLEPQVIASRVSRDRPARRCEKLHKVYVFPAQLHAHDPHPHAKHAFQLLVGVAEHFGVRNLLKRERRVEGHSAIHIAHRYSYAVHSDL